MLADGRNPDAALSEVEVHTFGENIALGTIERGGNIVERSGRGSAMVDGDPNSSWGYASYPTRFDVTWQWDLGAVFWIDRIIAVAQRGSDLYNNRIWASDGRQTLTGELEYDLLFDWYPLQSRPVQLTYVLSSPRALRHLHAQFEEVSEGHYNTGKFSEIAVFSTGHVAQVEMVSGFIDLGRIAQDDRPKVISSLSWDAEVPAGTRVQARTRSGNTLADKILYFHKDGTQITRAQYDDLIKPLKGKQETLIDIGEDWSVWSGLYQGSGDGFLSPSPRRYVQIRVLLSSDRPAAAATLRSISLDYENALVAGIKGEVAPREARPGIPQTFTYRLLPQFGAGDDGFDRILLLLPSRVDLDSLGVRIGDTEVEPTSVRISVGSDSLVVELPRVVREEGVEMEVRLPLIRNGTLLRAFVNHTGKDVPWQPVDPAERFATTVFLPTVPETTRLVAGLAVVPPVITPNGDGVGDQAEIRFSVLKVDKPATVRIYGLNGALIRELEGQLGPDLIWRYSWSGRDESGTLVPPGIYLSQTKLETQPGEETRTRTIGVAY